jgi:energy-coupling factor transport system permease/ATP-binding protein
MRPPDRERADGGVDLPAPTTMSDVGAEVVIRRLTWTPIGRRRPVLAGIDLRIEPGERVLLTGPSGSGKSTLLRAVAGVLQTAASGDLTGDVRVADTEPLSEPGLVGLVQQDPVGGLVAETAGRDVAFGLENMRVPRAEMAGRVAAALAAAGFPYGPGRPTGALSGGEAQRLALAGALVMRPRVLLLDEPTSMLDPAAESEVRTAIRRTVSADGLTTVVVDHDLGRWTDFVDRIVAMDHSGRLIADGPPTDVLQGRRDRLTRAGLWLPGLPPPPAIRVEPTLVAPRRPGTGRRLVTVADVTVRRRGRATGSARATELHFPGIEVSLAPGRAVAVTGPSGAGKSTIVQVLGGLLAPARARVSVAADWGPRRGGRGPWTWRSRPLARRVAWMAQLPEQGFVTGRVSDELRATARALGTHSAEIDRRCGGLLETLGLSSVADASPYHLSGGEQRRLVLASALVHGPDAVLLDEPTIGQDRHTWSVVVGICRSAGEAGTALALATHDRRAIDAVADDEIALAPQ